MNKKQVNVWMFIAGVMGWVIAYIAGLSIVSMIIMWLFLSIIFYTITIPRHDER